MDFGNVCSLKNFFLLTNEWRKTFKINIVDNGVSKTCEAGSDMVIEVHSGCNAKEHFIEHLHLAEC